MCQIVEGKINGLINGICRVNNHETLHIFINYLYELVRGK